MVVQFTGEIQFRSPITETEKTQYSDFIEELRSSMVQGHLTSLYFFEDSIDRRKLQNELIQNQSFLDKDRLGSYTQSFSLPIAKSSFIRDQRGKVITLDIENMVIDKKSCIYLYFDINRYREEILRSLKTASDGYVATKISPIFWDVWDGFKFQIQK